MTASPVQGPALPPGSAPLLLHVFPTFAIGGAQVRFAALANRFGPRWRHAIVALDGRTDCAERLDPSVPFALLPSPVAPGDGAARFRRIRAFLRRLAPSVLVTSNWGSIEWAAANLLPPRIRHIHTEDGFGPDEAGGQKPRRVLFRRLVLRRSTVVLPSLTLLKAAREAWRLPEARLHYIPNGLDLARFRPDGPHVERVRRRRPVHPLVEDDVPGASRFGAQVPFGSGGRRDREARMRLSELRTPALVLDRAAVARNTASMSRKARQHGVRLRPHLKTAKCVEVARLATEGQFGGITQALRPGAPHRQLGTRRSAIVGIHNPALRTKQRRQGSVRFGHVRHRRQNG